MEEWKQEVINLKTKIGKKQDDIHKLRRKIRKITRKNTVSIFTRVKQKFSREETPTNKDMVIQYAEELLEQNSQDKIEVFSTFMDLTNITDNEVATTLAKKMRHQLIEISEISPDSQAVLDSIESHANNISEFYGITQLSPGGNDAQ